MLSCRIGSLARNSPVFAVALALLLVVPLLRLWMVDSGDPGGLKVFASYWASGQAASAGENPYAEHPYTWVYDAGGTRVADLNLNPPVLLPLFQAFATLDPQAGAALWVVASFALFVIAIEIILRTIGRVPDRLQLLWVVLAPPVLNTLIMGQIYLLLMLLCCIAWASMRDGKELPAGVAIGLVVAIKPIFVLWPLFLFLAGWRRMAGLSIAAAGLLVVVSLGIYGLETWTQWIGVVATDRHSLAPTDASLQGYLTRLGLADLAMPAGALLVVGAGYAVARRRPSARDASAVALCVSILASPLAWFDYALLLYPALLARFWGPVLMAGAALLFVPPAIPFLAYAAPAPVAAVLNGIYPAGMMLLFLAFATRALRRGAGDEERASGWSARRDSARPRLGAERA